MACRRLAVLQGYYECKSPLSYRCFVALVPVRCCMPLFSLAVLRSMALCLCRLLDTAAVCAAVSCTALAVSVWLCILYRFIMCYIDCRCAFCAFSATSTFQTNHNQIFLRKNLARKQQLAQKKKERLKPL